ncbi:hypothetical protein Psuf_057510 [Phytohabitans suffuscus]|uniref:Uncharacterized protein n=1 Tax=Phytohabitans suffuscus TaxID=624315 RepID=A0A6F8YR88_9ACTN|nr:hypothetical protein [Phytohabitans suffuscus]BCB88438.1 hypothetical protein Psuf_057510 [Phytohabitans suffuscus]
MPGAPGVGLGRLHRVGARGPAGAGPDGAATGTDGAGLPADLGAAFDVVAAGLRKRAEALRADGHAEPAGIVETMALIADDPDLRGAAAAELAAHSPPAPSPRPRRPTPTCSPPSPTRRWPAAPPTYARWGAAWSPSCAATRRPQWTARSSSPATS